MRKSVKQTVTVDTYIDAFPDATQQRLRKIRQLIHRVLPDAEERISYGIPAITYGGKRVMYFAGFKNHVSVYPVPEGDAAFQEAIVPYRTGKGTLQFPLAEPLPLALVRRVIALHAQRVRHQERV